MRRLTLALGLMSSCLVVGALGCGTDGPGLLPYPHTGVGDDDGSGGSDLGSGGTTASVGPTGNTSASTQASTSTSTNSVAATTSITVVSATTGGGNEQCEPEQDDDVCVACAKDACCIEVLACGDDANCACWVGCVEQTAGAIDLCFGQCGLPGIEILDLLDCTNAECEAECGNVGL